jgi:zinc-ribbon domain
MFCGSCGKQVPDGATTCPFCGAAIPVSTPNPSSSTVSTGGGVTPSPAAAQRAKIEAQIKAGSQDALEAIKVLAKDPVGGLGESFKLFDEKRALIVGAIFGGVFAVAMMLAALRGAGMLLPGMGMMGGMGGGSSLTPEQIAAMAQFGYHPPSTISIMLKALLGGAIFAAVLMGTCAGARMVFKGASSLAGDIYMAGASLLPWTVFLVIATILGGANFEINAIVMLFALTYSILMLYSGFLNVGSISEGKAALAVPIMLGISFYLMSVVTRMMI